LVVQRSTITVLELTYLLTALAAAPGAGYAVRS
jgi:hypothetical protein